jgi:hypothetical protein
MHVGVPCAISAVTFVLAYIAFPASIPWYSPVALAAVVVLAGIEYVVLAAIARVGKRFDKRE